MDQYEKILEFRASTLASPVNALAISPDGRLLAICSDDHRVHIVLISSKGRVHKTVSTHLGPMSSAQWVMDAADAFWLFTGGHDGVVCSYRIRLVTDSIVIESDLVMPLTLGNEEVVDLVLDAVAKHLAVVCPRRVYMLEVSADTNNPLALLHQYPPDDRRDIEGAAACGAAFCTDEDGIPILVVAYTDSRMLRAFRVKPWTILWERHTGFKPSTIVWIPERQCLMIYCLQALDVKILELRNSQLVHRKSLAFLRPNKRHYSKDVHSANLGRLAICGTDEGTLVGWDLLSGQQLSGVLNHGRGDVGVNGGYPGLQVIASTTVLTASRYTNLIAGSSYSMSPVVIVWEMDKEKSRMRGWLIGHIVFDILCFLFAMVVIFRENEVLGWRQVRDPMMEFVHKVSRWPFGRQNDH